MSKDRIRKTNFDGFTREEEKLTNVLETRDYVQTKISVNSKGEFEVKSPKLKRFAKQGDYTSEDSRVRKTVQYFVRGTMQDGSQIVGRSPALGSPLAETEKEAIDRAWVAFYSQFSYMMGGSYDSDDGKNIFSRRGDGSVFSIDEGWIYYSPLPKKSQAM